jgi:large subunit ribosomal protein L6
MATAATETHVKESRIGKQLVAVPAGVTVTLSDAEIEVVGPKGRLVAPLPNGIKAEQLADGIRLRARSGQERAAHGLARALLANAVKGVTDGFVRELDIVGVGYKADLKGRILTLSLGYSHPVQFLPPDGVELKIEKKQRQGVNQYQTTLIVSGIDKQIVGQVCANLKNLRRPDAYKGKGVRIVGEPLRLKPGKSAK